jgi:hypothetical protein
MTPPNRPTKSVAVRVRTLRFSSDPQSDANPRSILMSTVRTFSMPARSGLDSDIDFNFEPKLATRSGRSAATPNGLLAARSASLRLLILIHDRDYPNNGKYVGLRNTAAFLS